MPARKGAGTNMYPLRHMEKFGVLAPDTLKKCHMNGHNNSDGVNSSALASEKDSNPKREYSMETNAAQTVHESTAPSIPKEPVTFEVADIRKDGDTVKLSFNVNVNHNEPHKTKVQKAAELGDRVGTIALGVLVGGGLYKGAEALLSWMFGGSDVELPPADS